MFPDSFSEMMTALRWQGMEFPEKDMYLADNYLQFFLCTPHVIGYSFQNLARTIKEC